MTYGGGEENTMKHSSYGGMDMDKKKCTLKVKKNAKKLREGQKSRGLK